MKQPLAITTKIRVKCGSNVDFQRTNMQHHLSLTEGLQSCQQLRFAILGQMELDTIPHFPNTHLQQNTHVHTVFNTPQKLSIVLGGNFQRKFAALTNQKPRCQRQCKCKLDQGHVGKISLIVVVLFLCVSRICYLASSMQTSSQAGGKEQGGWKKATTVHLSKNNRMLEAIVSQNPIPRPMDSLRKIGTWMQYGKIKDIFGF